MTSSHSPRLSLVKALGPADVFTLANASLGLLSILASHGRQPGAILAATVALPLAFAADALDGAVARATHRHGDMGRELDSLSDVISFGVAPAVLAHAVGLDGAVDVAFLLFFLVCAVCRLARFNVTAPLLAAGAAKVPYFEGVPVTVGVLAGVALGGMALFGIPLPGGVVDLGLVSWHPLSAVFGVLGCLMVSKTLRIPKP